MQNEHIKFYGITFDPDEAVAVTTTEDDHVAILSMGEEHGGTKRKRGQKPTEPCGCRPGGLRRECFGTMQRADKTVKRARGDNASQRPLHAASQCASESPPYLTVARILPGR